MHNDNMIICDRIKLDFLFDCQKLQDNLKQIQSNEWIKHFVTQNYDGNWSIFPLRAPSTATHPIMMSYSDPTCKEFSDTPFLQKLPYFHHVIESFKCPVQSVRLMKLTPSSHIKKHTDYDLAIEKGMARIHIPIITNNKVEFILNNKRVDMKEGECWYLRLSDPHSVRNKGNKDRIHLVIDIEVNSWFITCLKSNGSE